MSRGILVLITENSTNVLGLFWKCFRHNFTPDNAGVLGIDIKTAVNSNNAVNYESEMILTTDRKEEKFTVECRKLAKCGKLLF